MLGEGKRQGGEEEEEEEVEKDTPRTNEMGKRETTRMDENRNVKKEEQK